MTSAWGGLVRRGLDQLSPPEVERVLAELPAERSEYVSFVRDISGWPQRSVLGRRIPSDADVAELTRGAGRSRGVVVLEDGDATQLAVERFTRVFVLDPLYDTGDFLYAAWHDPIIRDEHGRHLALHSSRLVHLAPQLETGAAVLTPHHLPGSWDPRPSWRRLRPDADARTRRAWALRQALVLLYWADRLNGVMCVGAAEIGSFVSLFCNEPARRPRGARTGSPTIPEPALLLKRALDGRALDARPSLPRATLRRKPLCLFAASAGAVRDAPGEP